MIVRLALACSLSLLFVGCARKSEPTVPPPPPTEAATPDTAGVTPPAPPPVAASADDSAAALVELTQAVRKYSAEHQRVPADLAELVAKGALKSLPSPPPGKKFVINRKRVEVTLENQ